MTRTAWLAVFGIGLWSSTAGAQVRVFMSADGARDVAPTTGNTTIQIDPGTTGRVIVWLQDTTGGQLLHGYQLIFPDAATPGPQSTGSVTYVDINPGGGGGDSIFVDTARLDWIFALEIVALSPAYNESPGLGIFGVIYNTLTDQGVDPTDPADVPLPGGIHYLAEFELAVSADACGEFELPYNLPPEDPPHTALFLPDGGEYVTDELQRLTVTTGLRPDNDACSDAVVVGDGAHPFTTVCAATDGPDQPGDPPQGCQQFALSSDVLQDVWFSYTTPCTGTLTVSTCGDADFNTKIAVYGPDAACPPDPGELADCNDGLFGCSGGTSELQLQVTALQNYLIRAGGADEDAFGFGNLTLNCEEVCTPDLPVNDPLTIAQCGDPGQCADVSCDFFAGCVVTPLADGTPCTDSNACTDPDSCQGGVCQVGPPPDCTDDDPCTVDNCLFVSGCVNTVMPGLPCDAGGGPGSGTCNADGECIGCGDTADCADGDGDGLRDDICVWWTCDAGECVGTDIVYADMGGAFGLCPPDGTVDNNDRFHALNCFSNQDTAGNPLAYPCEEDPPNAYNLDAAGQFGSCVPDGVCDINDAFAALNAFAGTATCTCPSGGPTPAAMPAPPRKRPRR